MREKDVELGRNLHFRDDARGNVATMFAFGLIPLALAAGMAVDYSDAASTRARLQNATDAAILSAATAANLDQAQSIANRVLAAHGLPTGTTITITRPDPSVTRAASIAVVQTSLMKLVGYRSMPVHAAAEARSLGTGPIEVALALDTTGSMVNDMASLKSAARNLTTSLFNAAASNPDFRMSVVPFVAAVNPGRAVLESNGAEALDLTGQAAFNGNMFRGQAIGVRAGCTPIWGSGSSSGGSSGSTDPGVGGRGAALDPAHSHDSLGRARRLAAEMFGVRQALAADATANTLLPLSGGVSATGGFLPTGFITDTHDSCEWLGNPGVVSVMDLFNRVPRTTTTGAAWGGWKGCVEARPNRGNGATVDYDVTDDPPIASALASKFVPYFWPDEPDPGATSATFNNNWLPDATLVGGAVQTDPTAKGQWSMETDGWRRIMNILKYNGDSRTAIVEVAPDTSGPNKACPDEVLPLTSNRSAVLAKIDSLNYWNGGGTITSEGVMWAWRTLSPNKPYATARPYDPGTKKFLVLMSDGKNELGENGRDSAGSFASSPVFSDYNAYGYLRLGRFEQQTFPYATQYLDQRLLAACANAKAKGIVIFTVLFRETDANAASLLRQCASTPDRAFSALNGAELNAAFGSIGAGITKLRLYK